MKISTVEIKYNLDGNLRYSFQDLPYAREGVPASPKSNSVEAGLGFWHYPTKLGKRVAFDRLKDAMIKRRYEEIDKLQKSIRELEAFNYE